MPKISFKYIRILCIVGIIGMGCFLLAACSGDDGESVSEDGTGTILLYNYDNKDYRVELRYASDDTVLGALNVDDYEIIGDDWTDSFEDVPEGIYYLVILKDDAEVDRSSNFSIEEDDSDCYEIDDDGILRSC